MNVTLPKEKLYTGLKIVERVVGKSLNLPILNNIYLEASKNFLNLKSTDLEIGINWWGLAKVEKEGSVVVPSKILTSFIGFLPEKPINLKLEKMDLKIFCENYQTSIKCLSPKEYPIIPETQESFKSQINNKEFIEGLESVIDYISLSTTKPEISGIYFGFKKNQLILTATDSFRLGEKKINLKEELKKEFSFILPNKTARELINILKIREGLINFYYSPTQVTFEVFSEEVKHPEIQIVSRLIEGDYPKYQEIIPKNYTTQILLPKQEFLQQLKSASLFSNKINEIKININSKDKKIFIYSQNPELGEFKSFLPCQIKGEDLTTSFNWRFIIEGINNIKTPEIIFELNGEDGPGVIKPLNDDSFIYLVMPIKTS